MIEKKQLKEMPKRNPVSGTFELTVRCNLHCKMCLFRHDDKENADIKARELTTQQWIDLAKEVADAGTFSLLITGGEAMLRPDFCEIWEGIYKQGFVLTLYTNATLVSPKIMETLRKYPPHKIGVTIYGATPETYEKVCGHANAFKQAMEGIRQLLTLPSILDFRTTIIKDNYHEATAIEDLIHSQFGEKYQLTQTRSVTKAVRGACADVESCRLDPKDNVHLAFRRGINIIKDFYGDAYDEKNLIIQQKKCANDDKVYAPKLSLFGCDAGMSSYTISWDGQLLACQMLGVFSTDVLSSGFQKAWQDFPLTVKLPPIHEKCRKCENIDLCNCCYASRYAETGDFAGCPEYVCEDTAVLRSLINKGGESNE